ncbi:two-component system response regulator NarL [Actinobacillus equuli subsp. equuli]|uniref:Two-component system response regulator NarL n=2 Tax=Actinobacillus equuli TaxID=718 RepID=A0A0A7MG56_ACTEU|nr:two-component system response regulator NarL [Actinobacillus equuli]AIZ79554.1 nitrate/nitrite response regulator [Actinobacillus equuli subsp. equuli]MDE8034300.1 two-component system response regulator NarL [Actinobacillus equuli subsp. equuli]MDG4949073.1 two-component system response regulator NarL [Actinobacillus equuli subsp. haemolyticus]MDG4952788.1 two-component system response regulator NarL [Actinobacillus equuli subsp. equuli]WGE41448.1 two-component system response regulator Na
MTEPYKILLIDDHPLMRQGMRQILELEDNFVVIGEASNGTDGIALALDKDPDLIILDLNMKGISGLDTLRSLRTHGVDSRIIVLTVSDEQSDIFALMDAGVDGYLLKDSDTADLVENIRKAAKGEMVLSEAVQQHLLDRRPENDPLSVLTDRERDVLQWIATGMSNKQIAGQLFISEETVKVHIRNLLRKLNVHSRVAATVLYLEQQKG